MNLDEFRSRLRSLLCSRQELTDRVPERHSGIQMMHREQVSARLGMRNAQTLARSDVRELATEVPRDAYSVAPQAVTELHIREHAAQLLGMCLRQVAQRGGGAPLLDSAVKIAEAALIQEAGELALQLAVDDATAREPDEPGAGGVADVLMSRANNTSACRTDMPSQLVVPVKQES
jgi:hypothetical protein